MQPDTETRRRILLRKLAQHRATAYEATVNAALERKFGGEEAAGEWEKKSERNYRIARELQAMIDELPSENGTDAQD